MLSAPGAQLGGGRVVRHPRNSKITSLNESNFLRLTNFKLLSLIEGKSMNNCDVLKVRNVP
jgi:hypothetical protein